MSKYVIPKTKYKEMDRDVLVELNYPEIQIDMFEFETRHKGTKTAIMTSTIFNGDITYQYVVLNNEVMINGLSDKIYVCGIMNETIHKSVRNATIKRVADMKKLGFNFEF